MDDPCRLFPATLSVAARSLAGNEAEQGLEVRPVHRQAAAAAAAATAAAATKRARELQVSGRADLSCPADRASMRVGVGSSKESVGEVTGSVSRRLEYILQALRQNGVRDEDATVRQFLHRGAELYHMDAEVAVTFSDFERMELTRRVLLEKLDKSVSVGAPHFYHSAECLGELRQRAFVSAVENAHQKARKASQLLGQSLGPPLLVREEEAREARDEEEEEGGGRGQRISADTPPPHVPTVTASSQVSVAFALGGRGRNNL